MLAAAVLGAALGASITWWWTEPRFAPLPVEARYAP